MRNAIQFLLSPVGTIGWQSFAIAVTIIYIVNLVLFNYVSLSFLARGGALPFLIAQALLSRSWYALHAKRLASAGRGTAVAKSIAIIFMLGVVFFVLMAIGANQPAQTSPSETTFVGLLSLLLFASLLNGAQFGGLGYLFAAFVAIPLVVMLLVFAYSFVVGQRKPI